MGTITISVKDSNNEDVPTSSLQFSLRTSLSQTHTWVDSNEFKNLLPGTYYYSVKKRSNNTIIAQGTQVLNAENETPYEQTFTGLSEITISKSQHQKLFIKSVLVFDANGWKKTDNWQKLNNEGVLISLGQPETVTVRIS